MKYKIVLVCCTNVGRSIIELFLNNRKFKGIELSGVLNLNHKHGLKKSNYDSYIDLKEKYGINVKYIKSINDKSVYNWLKKIDPSIIIQSGWSQKFSKRILDIPKFGCIGQHPAPLPIGRGAACVNWAIILGYKKWGDSFFIMDEKYDNGHIIGQHKFTIEPSDDVKTVYDKVCMTSKKIFSKNISNWVKGNFKKTKQNFKKIIYFKKRYPEDGEIDYLNENNLVAHNKVRALTKPYPGAFIMFGNKKLFIWKSRLLKKKNINYKNINNRLFVQKNMLILALGKFSKSYLQIQKFQINKFPELNIQNISKYLELN